MSLPISRRVVFAVVAMLAATLAGLSILARQATAAHDDCALTADAPASYYGIGTIMSGSIDCATAKSVVRFSIALTMDGALVASGERTCHKAASCWSYLVEDDPAGDQTWCTRVSARVGSHAVGAVTRCESGDAI